MNRGPRTMDRGPRTLDHGLWTKDHGPWTKDLGPWTSDHGPWTKDHGLWTVDYGPRTMDRGSRTKDHGPWVKDRGLWAVDRGPWTMDRGPRTKDHGPWTELSVSCGGVAAERWSFLPEPTITNLKNMDKLEEAKVESQEVKVLARQTEVENLKRDLLDVRYGISHLRKEVERLKTINADVSNEAYLVLKEVHRLRKVIKGEHYRSSVLQEKEKDLMELREILYTTVEHMCIQNAVLKAENEDLRKDDGRLREIIESKSETANKDLTQNTDNDLLPMTRLENENSGERQKDLSPRAGESLLKMHLVFKSLKGFIAHGSKSHRNGVKSKVEADDGLTTSLATGSSDMDVTKKELPENSLLPMSQHSLQENDINLKKSKVFEENPREREKGLPAPAEVCAGQVRKNNRSVVNEIGGFCTHGLKKIPISTQESQSNNTGSRGRRIRSQIAR
ncbi:hypothetical protein FQN60_007342 [Etheostoma spectabile]|uniref:Uncharacterized protein n=1 Tax=Etheostoma spectabile TaxID=54343 RepID=A0A5J5C6P3_9PERO|nr:hypothetical protein FQN60_007342 [Etheostoma spectabile]